MFFVLYVASKVYCNVMLLIVRHRIVNRVRKNTQNCSKVFACAFAAKCATNASQCTAVNTMVFGYIITG